MGCGVIPADRSMCGKTRKPDSNCSFFSFEPWYQCCSVMVVLVHRLPVNRLLEGMSVFFIAQCTLRLTYCIKTLIMIIPSPFLIYSTAAKQSQEMPEQRAQVFHMKTMLLHLTKPSARHASLTQAPIFM